MSLLASAPAAQTCQKHTMSLPTGRRKGTCALWLKRNWVLLALFALALASAGLSVALFIKPCDKKTQYTTHNTSSVVNVTSYENRSVLENAQPRRRNLNAARRRRRTKQHPTQVTIRETIIELENVTSRENVSFVVNETVRYNATYNVTYDVLRNITYDITFNETYNITYNTHRRGVEFRRAVDVRKATPRRRTINVTEYVNATVNVTTSYNISSHQPVDVVLAFDASRSVSDADFVAENRAGRKLLKGLRDSLTGDLHAGVAVWAVDGVSRRDLTSIANATDVDHMEDVARLPYCAAVPPPYSEQAETYSNYFCVGDPPAVQDEDHAYDLRHDASQVWGLTTGTYYAQALLRCHDALLPQNDAFRLCVVVTDGQIDEDRYAQCVDDVRQPTMTYTSNMTGDYYDAGTEIFKDDCGWHASVRWIAPGAYAFCAEHGLAECTVDAIAATLKANGIKVLSVLVSENNDLEPYVERMASLASCEGYEVESCPYIVEEADFASLTDAASTIAGDVALNVELRTSVVEETISVETTLPIVVPRQRLHEEEVTETVTRQETISVVEPEVRQETRQEISVSTVIETTQEEITREVEVESIETRTSEELVTLTEEHVQPMEITEETVTQKTICTGSPISFSLLVLALPLLAYLFLKPILNCLENCCCPYYDDEEDLLVMHANPAFGIDQEDLSRARPMRRRSTIDKLLTRARHLRKKKNNVGGPLSPLRTASPKSNEEPRRRSAPLLARDADTDWSSGVAAVYDGDDWQESVADFVINLVCCRFCRKAPEEFEAV